MPKTNGNHVTTLEAIRVPQTAAGEREDEARKAAIEEAVRTILVNVGEDPDRQGLQKTPDRIARMYDEILAGYQTDPIALVNGALFDVEYDEMIVVKDIEFFSMCEHHMLPFFGKAHIAYIPNGRIVGLSKFARLVEVFARRFQVQERLTEQVAQALWDTTQPQGVAVVIEAYHLCMMMRGVEKQNSKTITSAMRGLFLTDQRTRDEFLRLTTSEHQPL